jgi:hypothetical protein
MRLLFLLLVTACGAEERHSASASPDPAPTASTTIAPDIEPAKPAAVSPECTGADVDIAKALASPGCQAGVGTTIDALNRLKIEVTPPAKVAPGAKAEIAITLTNDSDAPVQLRLFPLPWTALTKTTMGPHPCGTSAHLEQTASQLRAEPSKTGPAAQIVIPPKGRARASIPWEANGQKWSTPTQDKGTCKAEAVPTPLAPGSYSVTVRIPSVGVSIPEKEIAITVAK